MKMKDKVAIVTGAASGIGKGIALTCARAGARVAIADLTGPADEATVDGKFTPVQDLADAALPFAAVCKNTLTGQSIVVSHGWYIE